MNRRWFINRTNPEFVNYISKAASVSSVLAQILINRGIKSADDICDFLNPGITDISDPFELPDMKAAVERIKAALTLNERVLVHGDYDTDGLTATAIMVHALRKIGVDAHYFIPNRMLHGYGFNLPSVDIAKKLGVKLIITVDCGISSFDAAAYAKKDGIDVIITDHHEPIKDGAQGSGVKGQGHEKLAPSFILPEALAIINPKLHAHNSGLTNLSGAGIALKIVQALAMDHCLPVTHDDFLSLLDLAALGTLADVVPLTGENRIILKEGLRYIRDVHRPGIRALKEIAGLQGKEMKAGLLSFTLVPRINAAGRLADAHDVVNLFLSNSDEETSSIADKLDRTNTERQRIEEEVYQEALSQLKEKGYDAAIVLHNKGWHIGVIGIVASRIKEEFHRPTFIFTVEGNMAKGSARSIPPFDIYDGLSACRDILVSFGGHKQAAGVKLYASDLQAFEETINNIASDALKKEDFIPTVQIDAEVALSEVNTSLIKELCMLEPLGNGNPEPLLGARRLNILNLRVVGNNHLKMKLKQKYQTIEAIGFGMGELFDRISSSATVDAAFTPAINEWNGGSYPQLNLKAFRQSG